ncbi:MAG: tRNA (N(6)-L-threonylcarbamoyladenosine(37)-C(2))-methylthiotransferase MtaB [Candidatus Omnitrophota bacterium]|nr:tRNA (N(6)-L-threonylcarbamoyladenosine(37)-C(2))-methylthiotransferase MtaB [Candidatus Omnitrophota bacterium]
MKISFYTLGCRLNQSETASIRNSFEVGGYTVVDFDKPSDIAVINTCTVTEGGDTDTRRLVHRVNRLNPNARIALVGCQAQVQKERLATLPNVRWIVGNQKKMDLVDVFRRYPDPVQAEVITPTIEREAFTIAVSSVDDRHTRANIKIQDGCDFFCSFCEIPYARGRARSRVFDDIIKEARILAQAGRREIVLTGINIGTYGHEGKKLMDVIARLEGIAGIDRIRISSIEPTTIPLEIFGRMGQGKLCRYLHIPLQSGHDDILSAMKRKYTTGEFRNFIRGAYAQVPQICIGTDVIVGFPGETDAQFADAEAFLRQEPIHYFHVFSYSQRQMAKSKDMGEVVAPQTISKRSQILRDLSQRKRLMFYGSLIGTTQAVLFEEQKGGFWTGLTDNYARVKVRSDTDLHNQLVPVRLEKMDGQAIYGEY